MKLFEELLGTLPDGRVLDLRVGLFWTGVVSQVEDGVQCGLASTVLPEEHVHGEPLIKEAGAFIGERSKSVAALILEKHAILRSIGLAALNSIIPRYGARFDERNADEIIATLGRGKRVVLVGHFPFTEALRGKVPQLQVLELRPRPGDLPAEKAAEVIPFAEVVAITSMTLINGTFEGLLALVRKGAHVILLGPSTPLSPRLFDAGVDVLCGCVVEKIPAVMEMVSQGGNFRQIHRAGTKLFNLYSKRVNVYFN